MLRLLDLSMAILPMGLNSFICMVVKEDTWGIAW